MDVSVPDCVLVLAKARSCFHELAMLRPPPSIPGFSLLIVLRAFPVPGVSITETGGFCLLFSPPPTHRGEPFCETHLFRFFFHSLLSLVFLDQSLKGEQFSHNGPSQMQTEQTWGGGLEGGRTVVSYVPPPPFLSKPCPSWLFLKSQADSITPSLPPLSPSLPPLLVVFLC